MSAQNQATIKPANLLRSYDWKFEYQQKCNPANSNLDLITYGTYRIAPGATSDELYHRNEEALLFCMHGQQTIEVEGKSYSLSHYDTLYIPLQTSYEITETSAEEGELVICRAPAESQHQVFYSEWEKIRVNEERIRHLDKKEVYMMFDVSENADKLVAGYTIYEPYTRAWPPHNHTDQEEVYIFTQGQGSIEVYPDEEHKTFVHSMDTMDAATIPVLNYHPVYSQEEELHFIWCLAGERYWVGDKHQSFMDASVDELTT
ncbi:MAG: 5-deoxy-glucuronate isomerase [Verrucomicrobiales bacterium]|nr:5-deoxy-glucuronate isomerase [Verrucomicrobiales bacterium]